MLALIAKALLAGAIIATISIVAQRLPAMGALIASLPLVSILGMIFLWSTKPDATNMAVHAEATFWYVLPSLPMFLLIPWMLRQGFGFWPTLVTGCAMTIALYGLMLLIGRRFGLPI